MKRSTSIILALCTLASCLAMASCSGANANREPVTDTQAQTVVTGIKIPDIVDADEVSAKNVVSSIGLVPKVSYEYDDNIEVGHVVSATGNEPLQAGDALNIVVSKGPRYYELGDCVGIMTDIEGIDRFSWEDPDTKGFYTIYVEEGYLYIPMYLCCTSQFPLAFYKDFGTASITDTFDKTVPITIIYDNNTVNNTGEKTSFTAKIPLRDLDVQKPTNIYLDFDFLVNGERKTFKAAFDLTWQ